MSGYFQGFGRAFFRCFVVPLFLLVSSLTITDRMGLTSTGLSIGSFRPGASGMSAQTKLYLLRIPGMRWVLLEGGGQPTQRIKIDMPPEPQTLKVSLRPQLRPDRAPHLAGPHLLGPRWPGSSEAQQSQ